MLVEQCISVESRDKKSDDNEKERDSLQGEGHLQAEERVGPEGAQSPFHGETFPLIEASFPANPHQYDNLSTVVEENSKGGDDSDKRLAIEEDKERDEAEQMGYDEGKGFQPVLTPHCLPCWFLTPFVRTACMVTKLTKLQFSLASVWLQLLTTVSLSG